MAILPKALSESSGDVTRAISSFSFFEAVN
jgi:hypothetical protein